MGKTPLMHAIDGGCIDIVKELIIHGADVNVKDNSGWTALTHAKKMDIKK